MELLILGLALFLGVHSVRVGGEGLRERLIARLGPMAWKGAYSLASLVGLVLMVKGYGQARLEPVVLWMPPMGLRHAASLLTLAAFILLAAAYVPRNAIKARLRHPMTLAVKAWALAHLLSNGSAADVLLFGGFLAWSVLVFRAARRRDRMSPPAALESRPTALALSVALGVLAWAAFAFWAHAALIGVRPFGGA